MNLRNKINLYTSVLFIGLLIFINFAIYFSFSKIMLSTELERTVAEAKQAIIGINQVGEDIPRESVLRAYVPINGMLQIVKADGTRGIAALDPEVQHLHMIPVTYYKKEVQKITDYDGSLHAFVSIPLIWTDGEIVEMQVTESLKATDEMLNSLKWVLMIATAIAMIPVLISSTLLSNVITRPITSMTATMREIKGSGEFKRIPLPKESKDELYQMGETFNKMIDLLEVNYDKQGQFISNASHELKTPLTVIESYASLLKRRGKDQPEVFDESVEAIHSEAIRMKELTQQLLLLAKNEEQWNVRKEEVRLSLIVEELVRSYEKAYHREIRLEMVDDLIAAFDVQKFKQLFYILMDNARKYSEETIEVQIGKEQQLAVVKIIDRGIGIPSADLEKVFDRFYRVDKARTRKTGGYGLGLSLAKEIADAIGAEIRLESIEGLGTTASISIPLMDSH